MRYNVERAEFDLDTFQQILEAMDGYYVLPWLKQTDEDHNQKPDVEPWELPGMPPVSEDTWRYHVGFAVDRGFVECWTLEPDQGPKVGPMKDAFLHQMARMSEREVKPLSRGHDPNVSSELRPARLTYAGKEFIDNLKNPSVKAKALEAAKRWGVPAMMQVAVEAAKNLVAADASEMVEAAGSRNPDAHNPTPRAV